VVYAGLCRRNEEYLVSGREVVKYLSKGLGECHEIYH
jgi:hypothetical protein